jgi:hypothetical protein
MSVLGLVTTGEDGEGVGSSWRQCGRRRLGGKEGDASAGGEITRVATKRVRGCGVGSVEVPKIGQRQFFREREKARHFFKDRRRKSQSIHKDYNTHTQEIGLYLTKKKTTSFHFSASFTRSSMRVSTVVDRLLKILAFCSNRAKDQQEKSTRPFRDFCGWGKAQQ